MSVLDHNGRMPLGSVSANAAQVPDTDRLRVISVLTHP